MPDLIGQSLGRYHILEKLGEGGMATVYKAFDTHLEYNCAVKVIRTENLPQNGVERALKRFEREARSVARLSHPNVVKVTDFGKYEDNPYLVMPLLSGGTLKQLIKRRGQIPWKEAVQLLIPIAEALEYAHEHKVIHRDVKPSNILLTEKGTPMLTDFGVAKVVEEESTQDLTGTSTTVGTPEYMAPEQITSKTVDTRADLYSLGVVFYEMVTGRRPYEADTPLAVLFKKVSEPLPRPSQFTKDLPEVVERFLLKALAKTPADRYQSAGKMEQALVNLIPVKSITPEQIPINVTTRNTPKFTLKEKLQKINKKQARVLTVVIVVLCIFASSLFIVNALALLEKPPSKAVNTDATLPSSVIVTSESSLTMEPVPTATDLPVPTFTALVPTSTATIPIQTVPGSLTKNVKCRKGPDVFLYGYDLTVGQQNVKILGKSSDGDWINFLTTTDNQACWTIKQYVQTETKIESLTTIPDPVITGEILYATVKMFCWNDGLGWGGGNTCTHYPSCFVEKTNYASSSDAVANARTALAGTSDQKYYEIWGAIPYSIESTWDDSSYPCPVRFNGYIYYQLH
jgi:serine/threonine protein kinase